MSYTNKLQLLLEMPINKLRQNVNTARNTIKGATNQMKDKLQEIKIPKVETNRLKVDMERSEQIVDTKVDKMKNKLSELSSLKTEAIDGIGNKIGMGNLAASLTNPYTAAAAAIGAVAVGTAKLTNQLIENSKEISAHQDIIKATIGATGEELKELTATGMATSKVLGADFKEITTAANTLHKEYADLGLSGKAAMELIQKGLIATNGMMDIDNIREYSVQLREAGLTAEEAIMAISSQTREGVFSDKGVDAIKEFGLRIREMTPAAVDALKGIGINADDMKKRMNEGKLSVIQAMNEVTTKMQGVPVQKYQTAIADLFGGPGEDLGGRMLKNMAKIGGSLDEQIDSSGLLSEHKKKMIALETQLVMKNQEYAPAFNELNNELEILKLEGKLWFSDMVNDGITTFKEYKEEFKLGMEVIKWSIGTAFDNFKFWIGVIGASVRLFVAEFKIRFQLAQNYVTNLRDNIIDTFKIAKLTVKEFAWEAVNVFAKVGAAWEQVKQGQFSAAWDTFTSDAVNPYTSEKYGVIGGMMQRNKDYLNNQYQLGQQSIQNLKGYKLNIQNATLDYLKGTSKKNQGLIQGFQNYDNKTSANGAATGGTVGSIISNSQQGSRTVTVNIDSFIKGDVISQNKQIQNMDKTQMRRWLSEMLMGATRDAELGLA